MHVNIDVYVLLGNTKFIRRSFRNWKKSGSLTGTNEIYIWRQWTYMVFILQCHVYTKQNISHEKVRALNKLVGSLIVCGSRSTSVLCALLYISRSVPVDSIRQVDVHVYSKGDCNISTLNGNPISYNDN